MSELTLNQRQALDRGRSYYWDHVVNLKDDGPYVYSFDTTDIPIVVGIRIVSPPEKGMEHSTFEVFEGGAVSGGIQVNSYPLNQNEHFPSPYVANSVFHGRTITTPGVLVLATSMVGFKKERYDQNVTEVVLLPDTPYYMVIGNVSGDNELLHIIVTARVMQ